MTHSERDSQPLREIQGTRLLTKAAISSLIAGVWGLAVFAILFGTNFMRMSDIFFRPVIETFWGVAYLTYPSMFLSYFVGYVVLVSLAVPILLYFCHNLYKVSTCLKLTSLRFLAFVWLGIAFASIVLVPFAYQNALDAIAAYNDIGILVNYVLIPLGLPAIQVGVTVLLLLSLFTLMAGAIIIRRETSLNRFTAVAGLASMGLLPMLLSIEYAIRIGSVIFLLGDNELGILVLALAFMLFGIGLGELGARSGNWRGGSSLSPQGA